MKFIVLLLIVTAMLGLVSYEIQAKKNTVNKVGGCLKIVFYEGSLLKIDDNAIKSINGLDEWPSRRIENLSFNVPENIDKDSIDSIGIEPLSDSEHGSMLKDGCLLATRKKYCMSDRVGNFSIYTFFKKEDESNHGETHKKVLDYFKKSTESCT